ncbi:MAG: hypothetical protein ACRC2T_19960 [Thermoguttaceae bacterium]
MKKIFLPILTVLVFAVFSSIQNPVSAQEERLIIIDNPYETLQGEENGNVNIVENVNKDEPIEYEYAPTQGSVGQEFMSFAIQKAAIAESQGNISWARLLDEPAGSLDDVLNYVELSPEQVEAINNSINEIVRELETEVNKFFSSNTDSASEAEIAAFLSNISEEYDKVIDEIQAKFEEVLTPEQLQQMKEYELVAPSVLETVYGSDEAAMFPTLPNFGAYSALDLSEEQLHQLDAIQAEAEADFKTQFDELKNILKETGGSLIDPNNEKLRDLKAKNAEKFQNLRLKVHGILTPEQLARLEELESKITTKQKKAAQSTASETNGDTEPKEWRPDANSWKPGDPLPEDMKVDIKPPTRFPRGKETQMPK